MNYSELLQPTKGWGNFKFYRVIIWRLQYFKQKLFGSSSERRSDLPSQLNLFSNPDSEEEPLPELIEPEFIEIKSSKRGRKPKANYDEMFAGLPIHYEEVDTLSGEEKQCLACGTVMVPIGHEEIRTELRYTKAKLERRDCFKVCVNKDN